MTRCSGRLCVFRCARRRSGQEYAPERRMRAPWRPDSAARDSHQLYRSNRVDGPITARVVSPGEQRDGGLDGRT